MGFPITYNNVFDLYYEIFNSIGLAVNRNQYLYDQDTGNVLKFGDKLIKATINPNIPIYAGRNDIVFDPSKNYQLVSTLFGYYIDKTMNSENPELLQGYIAHYIDDNITKDKQRIVVKTSGKGEIASRYYYNIYLAYFDCILRIEGFDPDLTNLDIMYQS